MPRYFFNVHNGKSRLDRSGTELHDARAAQTEAIRLAGDLLAEGSGAIECGDDWSMDVQDEDGLTLFWLNFKIVASANFLVNASA